MKQVSELVVLKDLAYCLFAICLQIDYASEAIEVVIATILNAEVEQGLRFFGQLRELHKYVLLLSNL